MERLDQRLHRPLTLISAPAGYGKSTLVSCWLDASDVPSAWVSLDDGDDDLRQFLSYFVAAVQIIFPDAGRKTQAMLNTHDLPPVPTLVSCMINELDQVGEAFILVLDDYHFIRENAVHGLLSALLKYPPAPMHLVLATRRDPPLPIATLRARSLMTEIRVQELRFSAAESATFLRQVTGRPLDDHIVAILEEKTEGWVTGLRLAALTLRNPSDRSRILKNLPEDNRYIMDYILSEVLSQQSLPIQKNSKFLLAVLIRGYVKGFLRKVRSIFDTTLQILVFCAVLVLIVAFDRPVFTDQRLLGISRQARIELQQDMQS